MEQVDRVAAYAAGELHAEERAAFERALERDPDLRAQLAALRHADAALDAFPAPEPPEGFDDRIDAFVTSVLSDTLGGGAAASTSEATDSDGPAADDSSTEPVDDQQPAPPSHLAALPTPDHTEAAGTDTANTEAAGPNASGAEVAGDGDDELAGRRAKKRGLAPTLGAVAAGLVLLVGGVVVVQTSDILDGPQVDSAFEGADQDSAEDSDVQADADAQDTEESSAEGDAPLMDEDATEAEEDGAAEDADPGATDGPAPDADDADDADTDDSPDSPESAEQDTLFDDESTAAPEPHSPDDGPMVMADAGALTLSDLEDLLNHDAFELWDGINIGDGHEIASDLEDWPAGYDVDIDEADAAQAASCFNQFVTSSPASIVTFVAFGSYEGTDAIVFGLLTPDDDQYIYRDVFAVSAESCGLLDFTRNY